MPSEEVANRCDLKEIEITSEKCDRDTVVWMCEKGASRESPEDGGGNGDA